MANLDGELLHGGVSTRVVVPDLDRADSACAPRPCPRLGAAPGGLALHRLDVHEVPFADLRLVAAFEDRSASPAEARLLLFVHGHARPFSVATARVRFVDFSDGAVEESAALRALLLRLARACPGLAFEALTSDYARGARDALRACPALALATGLDRALRSEGAFAGSPALAPAAMARPVPTAAAPAMAMPSIAPATVGLVSSGLPSHLRGAGSPAPPSEAGALEADAPASMERRLLATIATCAAALATALVLQFAVSAATPDPNFKTAWLMLQRLSWPAALAAAVANALLLPLLLGDGRSLGQALTGIAHEPIGRARPPALIVLLRAIGNASVVASFGLLLVVARLRADGRGLADLLSATAQRAEAAPLSNEARRRSLAVALLAGVLLGGNLVARLIFPDPHDATMAQLREIRQAIRRFGESHKGRPPTSFGQLPATFEDVDGWGNRFAYAAEIGPERATFEIRSAGRDQQLGTPDDLVLSGTAADSTLLDGAAGR